MSYKDYNQLKFVWGCHTWTRRKNATGNRCQETEMAGPTASDKYVQRKRYLEKGLSRERDAKKDTSTERGTNTKRRQGKEVPWKTMPIESCQEEGLSKEWGVKIESRQKNKKERHVNRKRCRGKNQAKRTWCQEKTSSEQAAKRKRCQGKEISRETALKKNGCNKRFPESSIGFRTKGLKGRRCRGKECQVTRGWSPQVNLPKLRYSTAMFCTKAHSMQSVLVLRNHGNSYRQNLTHIPVRTWGVDLYEHECGIIWAWIRLQVVPRQAKGRNFRRSKNTGKTKQNVPRGRKKCAVQKQSLDIFVTWHLFLFASLPLGISCFVVRLTGNFYLKNITWTKKQNQIKNKKQIQTQLI